MGGLVGDMHSFTEDFDPIRAVRSYVRYWREVYEHTRMSYPVGLEWMYVSTEPAGQAVKVEAGEWVRYRTPYEGGAEYVSVCLPAFSPETVHRDDA